MKRFMLCLPAFFLICIISFGQVESEYDAPSNVRDGNIGLYGSLDLTWTIPEGWVPSIIDRWYDYDKGIWDGNALGSCMDCPAEAAVRWDAIQISMYDTVYLTKIRYVLTEPQINYRLRVYQGTPDSFDTLLNIPLVDSLVYNTYDTMNLEPILLNTSRDLWIGYWVNSLASGFPLPFSWGQVAYGYNNLFRYGAYWETITDVNPDFDRLNWSIGGYLETPHDSVIYPLFNIFRSYDDLPFEKLNEDEYFDTVFYDKVNHEAAFVRYYVTCVYEDGESEPSDTLTISMVGTPEIFQKNDIRIYPNPATDHVTIQSDEGKISYISLMNIEGKEVLQKVVDSEKIILDVSRIPDSFYVLKTVTSKGIFTSKLLIIK